jgi:hypothetical protein
VDGGDCKMKCSFDEGKVLLRNLNWPNSCRASLSTRATWKVIIYLMRAALSLCFGTKTYHFTSIYGQGILQQVTLD